ncbi:MAG TPA: hypothetical protein DEF07_03345 [Nitrosomonas sp.]|nr:hypothetical protein [Nitrosomonas sp.]
MHLLFVPNLCRNCAGSELIVMPKDCIDGVITHKLCHLRACNLSRRFINY